MSFIQSGRPYYYCSNKRIYLHRYLWEKENGKIPEGFEIHHRDHDANNNDIDNLQLMDKKQHRALHANLLTLDRREAMRKNMNEKARPKAIKWHKSERGSVWHKEHYERMKSALHAEKSFVCECCSVVFEKPNKGNNRFCSNKCKSKWRRLNGLDNVKRICTYCMKEFEINKYRKTTHCSKVCSAKNRNAKDSPN